MIEKIKNIYGYEYKIEALKESFYIIKKIYKFILNNYIFFLPLIYGVTIFWQAYMVSDIIDNMSVFYYVDIEYSIILFVKIFILILLATLITIFLILFIILTPFLLSSFFFSLIIGTLVNQYIGSDLGFYITLFLFPILWFLYYKLNYKKIIIISIIIITLISGAFFAFPEADIFKKEKDDVKLILEDNTEINGELNFYNGKYYFIETLENKEIINDKYIFKIIYK